MPPIIDSFVVLAIVLILARFIKRGSGILQKLFIPSSLVAGVGGLILGPQILGAISSDVTHYWAMFPKHLINIVFAGLFLGKFIPSRQEIWKQAGPMIAFGNTLAWGQYVLGIALTMLFLTPVFGANPLAGSLMELSFEGGHGSAAGLAPTYHQLGWPEGVDIALGLATLSIIVAVISGIIMINIHNRRSRRLISEAEWEHQRNHLIRSGYNLVRLTEKVNTDPKAVVINIAAFATAIGIGWLILRLLIICEDVALGYFTDLRFFQYVPLFPMAMIGGLIVQLVLKKLKRQRLIQRRTAEIISAIALDLLIASAIATVSLRAIGDNLPIFITIGLVGIIWILGSFLFFAPRMFKAYWFERGITNTGQSMGMTATGLLLNRLVDPTNHTHSRESFAYKQLAFEPFMGGGIITATAAIVIHEFGSLFALVVSAIVLVFWIVVGLRMGKKHSSQ